MLFERSHNNFIFTVQFAEKEKLQNTVTANVRTELLALFERLQYLQNLQILHGFREVSCSNVLAENAERCSNVLLYFTEKRFCTKKYSTFGGTVNLQQEGYWEANPVF